MRSTLARAYCVLWLLAACSHPSATTTTPIQSPPSPVAAGAGRRVLATFEARPYTYEVSVLHREPAAAERDVERFHSDGGRDPFSVRLMKSDRALDELLLFQTSCGQSSVRPVDGARGGDSESQSWTTEYDTCDTRIAVRTVALAGPRTALLLTQATGYEYRYSKHFLYLAEHDKLRTVWSYLEDTTGRDRASLTVLPTDVQGRQDIGLVQLARGDNGAVKELTLQRLRFEPGSGKLEASPLPDASTPLHVVVLGAYDDIRVPLQMSPGCLDELDVFERALLPGLDTPPFYLGGVFVRRTDADAVVASLRECPDLPVAQVLTYRAAQRGEDGGAH